MNLLRNMKMNIKLNKQVLHEIQKENGFFDGRFRVRKIKNKKREMNKRVCRRKVIYNGVQ